MIKSIMTLLISNAEKAIAAIHLVSASINDIEPFNPGQSYTLKELEPYDALNDRFIRAVEISLRLFRTYERYSFAENSETLRDMLNRMEKLKFISSV
ncbi:hypothetical protein JW835_14630 [bacterium]|nr:hypothetical protein [bacterium]